MTLSMDKTLEFSNITRLSSRNSIVDNEVTLNTVIIHPLASVPLDDGDDNDASSSSDDASCCSSDYSISEGHTHSLSPSDSKPTKHEHAHSNHYKHLEQQMIDNMYQKQFKFTKQNTKASSKHKLTSGKPRAHSKRIIKTTKASEEAVSPIHPPNIITWYPPYPVPAPYHTTYEYTPHFQYYPPQQPSAACSPHPIYASQPYQSYPQNYSPNPMLLMYTTPAANCNNCNVAYVEYPHWNAASTPITVSSSLSSSSSQTTTRTPVYNTTPTNSDSTACSVSHRTRNHNNNNNKYWDIAELEGDKYPLYDFAAQYFQVSKHQKPSLFRTNSRSNHHNPMDMKLLTELFSFAPFKKVKHSLLIMDCADADKRGVQIWKHINSYMGVRKSNKSRQSHVEHILTIGLHSHTVMRDEIFCQIVKQTNCSNVDKKLSVDKLMKGWQLMCICCSVLCPSSVFAKYLATYLLDKAKDDSSGDGKVSPMAIFALSALDESMKTGPRKVVPSAFEISHMEKCQSIPMKIYFLDDTWMTMLVAPQTTAKQLAHAVSNKLKLKHSESFSLYEMEQIPLHKYCEYELKRYNSRLDMSYHEKIKDLDMMPMDRQLEWDERIMDVYTRWKTSALVNRKMRFVYRHTLFNKYEMDHDLYSPNEWKLIFMNEQYNVVHSKYRIHSEKDLLHLAAIQLHANKLKGALSDDHVYKYIPRTIYSKYGAQVCKELMVKAAHSMAITTQKQGWMCYIQYLCQSHDAYLFVGCSFFRCIGKRKHNDLIVGINEDSILMINPMTKQIIDRYKLEEILTYGYKSNSFIFVAGTLLKQIKYQFATKHGKEMNRMLRQYIDMKSTE